MSKNSAKGSMVVHVSNAFLAGAPTLFPKDFDGNKKSSLTFTVIVNEGTDKQGKEYKSSTNVKLFGPLAEKLAYMLDKGSAVNMMALLKSYAKPTGQVVDGKATTITTNYLVARDIHVLPESAKKREENLNRNLNRLYAEGLVPETLRGVLTAQALLGHVAPSMIDFNAAVSTVNGLHGFARVWTKDRKFWDNGVVKTTSVANAAAAAVPGLNINDPVVKGILETLAALTAAKAVAPVAPVADTAVEVVPEIVDDMPEDVQMVMEATGGADADVAIDDNNIFNQA